MENRFYLNYWHVLFVILLSLFQLSGPCDVLGSEDDTDAVNLSLGDLLNMEVESVAFFKMSARQAPGSVHVVDVEEAKKGVFRTPEDILYKDVPGVVAGRHLTGGTLIGMRGIMVDSNAKTIIMLDGQQLNQRTHFGYTAGLQTPLIGDLRKMELTLGPGAIVHGSGAINGFVNFVPKNGTDNPGTFVNMERGFREESVKFETGYGLNYGDNRDIFLYAGFHDAKGFISDYENTPEWGESLAYFPIDPETRVQGNKDPALRAAIYLNHDDFSLNAFYQEINGFDNAPENAFSGVPDSDPTNYFHQALLGVRPKYTFHFSDTDSLELTAAFEWQEHGWSSYNASGGSESHQEGKMIFRTTRFEYHRLAAGALWGHRDFREKKQFFHSDLPASFVSVDSEWDEYSLFAENIYTVLEGLTLSFGIRYDAQSDAEFSPDESSESAASAKMDSTSFRIAAAYSIMENMTLKASFQQGFRTPDAVHHKNVAQWNIFGRQIGVDLDLELEPEKMDSYSLSLSGDILDNRFSYEITGYYNKYKNLLVWGDYAPMFSKEVLDTVLAERGWFQGYLNVDDKLDTWGGELSAACHPSKDTLIRASYGLARVTDPEKNGSFPRNTIKLNIGQYLFDRNLFLNLAGVYHDGREDGDEKWITMDSRIQVDASLRYQVTEYLHLKLLAQNLFGEDVPPPTYYEPVGGGLGFDETMVYAEMGLKF